MPKKPNPFNPNSTIGRLNLLEFRINEHNKKIDNLCKKIDTFEITFTGFMQEFQTMKGILKYIGYTVLGGVISMIFWLLRSML